MSKSIRNMSIALAISASAVLADATLPSADLPGSKDHAAFKRFKGSFIVSYSSQYDEAVLPISKLEPVTGKMDSHNNNVYEPKQKLPLEGTRTRIVYILPKARSPAEAIANYQDEIKRNRGTILFKCTGAECGGDATRSFSGGGGGTSLAMYLYDQDRVKDDNFSNGNCAQTAKISDQRYLHADLPGQNLHASILAYNLADASYCDAILNMTVVVVDIIESAAHTNSMVTVSAGEMDKAIKSDGKIALYGIYFDSNKDILTPESEATLQQISALLTQNKALKLLVVGHTDNAGGYAANQDLSTRRAKAVVDALSGKYQVSKSRLTPVGVSSACPISSNKTDDGKAKNRRVELVEN